MNYVNEVVFMAWVVPMPKTKRKKWEIVPKFDSGFLWLLPVQINQKVGQVPWSKAHKAPEYKSTWATTRLRSMVGSKWKCCEFIGMCFHVFVNGNRHEIPGMMLPWFPALLLLKSLVYHGCRAGNKFQRPVSGIFTLHLSTMKRTATRHTRYCIS